MSQTVQPASVRARAVVVPGFQVWQSETPFVTRKNRHDPPQGTTALGRLMNVSLR